MAPPAPSHSSHPDQALEARLEVRFAALQQRIDDRFAVLDEKISAISDKISDAKCPAPGRCLVLQEMIATLQRTVQAIATQQQKQDTRLNSLEGSKLQLMTVFGVIALVTSVVGPNIIPYLKALLSV